ncbi:hypothetical protein CTI12_AA454150 [Artemisia annua]|uniref:Uncharacterized protein n=1 Tax=Artemisia annua TaxID=35608 RepID=A0A2U1LRJ3_ARTAN|nr:hypothetical protein CTI12_AA454150 [Artemisia annua]
MGTEFISHYVKEEGIDIPLVPPGFESFTPFRTNESRHASTSSVSTSVTDEPGIMSHSGKKIKRSSRRRSGINYKISDCTSEDEPDHKPLDQINHASRFQLPKGVIRGCEKCSNCQKVTAKWHPEEARVPNLSEAPVFYPTEEEFEDTLKYIASIRDKAEAYGICLSTSVTDEPGIMSHSGKKIKRSSRRRSGINYKISDCTSEDEPDHKPLDQINHASRFQLPKGVIRGCEKCSNCQKVTAKWHPEEARVPNLSEAPVFYPTEEEFEDTLKYIASIRDKAEAYGICRIVPPSSWKPPCPLKDKAVWENSSFLTRIQRIDKLQNRDSLRKLLRPNDHKKKKRRRYIRKGTDHKTDNGSSVDEPMVFEADFGFEPGPSFTLDEFKKYADDFKAQYFRKNGSDRDLGDEREPSVENIEGEFWRIVEKPTEEIEVLYGADVETCAFGSGFPSAPSQVTGSDEKYVRSGWNLNNIPKLPGSLLTYESSDISGVLVPWLYIGMCFSSFCWHVEDHNLYSISYMHCGAPKMWYGVAGKDALKFEAAMRKKLPDLFAAQPDLLHKLAKSIAKERLNHAMSENLRIKPSLTVTQLSPTILNSEGVPVYRCIQNPGDFVLTFPRSYHSGFNCGFNCAEAVNVAPFDWLPHGHTAIELYREQGRKTSISHDKLLLGAAIDAAKAQWEMNLLRKNTPVNLKWKLVCGKNGVLTKVLKERVEMERVRRDFLCTGSQSLKMEATFDSTNERECSVCYFDLHLSAAGCHNCSPAMYSCLNHTKQFCSCSSTSKFFLFRYDMSELGILVEALEGKLSAIYRWAKSDHGLALTNHTRKEVSPSLVLLSEKQKDLLNENETMKSSEGKDEDEFTKAVSSKTITPAVADVASTPCPVFFACGSNQETFSRVDETGSSKDNGPGTKVDLKRNFEVELLQFGDVQSGKLWCDNRAIYPKGFRSRVKYLNILDPSNVCYYISEILDAERDRPMFMVSLENCPSEAFIHLSAEKCWEMVRERINQEISKRRKLGISKLPPLQRLGSLNGMKMFGFSSSFIVQGIQLMDRHHVSKEYWGSRGFNTQSEDVCRSPFVNTRDQNNPNATEVSLPTGADTTLMSLVKKANLDELNILMSLLNGKILN